MPSPNRLDELFQTYWEARRAGRPVSPAELCRDCPELLDALRQRIEGEPKPLSKLVRRPVIPGKSNHVDNGLRA
jgi:hypothetical protein